MRFKLGDRVKNHSYLAPVPVGMTGAVSLVAGFKGKSIYCDPCRLMIFVDWDNGQSIGVFKKELTRIGR